MPNYNTQGITSSDANDPRNTPTSTSSGIMSSTSNPTDNDDNEPSFFESIANFFSGAGADLPSSTNDDDGDSGASFYDSPMFDPYDGGSDNDTATANDLATAIDNSLYEALSIDVPEVYTGMMGEEEPEPNIDMDVLQKALQPDPITVEELEVKAGDTLSGIAKDKGVSVQAVIDANPQIKNPDMIRPGEVVSIPDPRFEGVPKPRGVADSLRLSDSTVTPIEKDTGKGLMAPPAQDTAPEIDTGTAEPSTPADPGDVAEGVATTLFTGTGNNTKPVMKNIKDFATDTYKNPIMAAAFSATVEAESGKALIEKGYEKKRAIEVFVDRNKRKDGTLGPKMKARKAAIEALPADHSSDDIFDIVYGGRMGNTEPGDGSKYKGRGLIMITGKTRYKDLGDKIGVDLVKNPDLLETDKDVMLRATLAYLEDKKFSTSSLSQSKLASIIGHSDDDKGTEAKKRWKRTKAFYKEMTGKDLPSRPSEIRKFTEDQSLQESLRPVFRPERSD